MAAAQITTVLVAPLRSEGQAVFDPKAETFLTDLPTAITEINAVSTNVNANAVAALASETAAALSAAAAVVSASAAASSSNYVGEWSTLTGAKTVPLSCSNNGVIWVLVQNIADVTAVEPGTDPATWLAITQYPWTVITSATNAVSGGRYLCDTATTAAFTLTFPTSPPAGSSISVKDVASNFATDNVTIGRGGEKVVGLEADFVLDVDNVTIEFVYASAALGWRI